MQVIIHKNYHEVLFFFFHYYVQSDVFLYNWSNPYSMSHLRILRYKYNSYVLPVFFYVKPGNHRAFMSSNRPNVLLPGSSPDRISFVTLLNSVKMIRLRVLVVTMYYMRISNIGYGRISSA